MTPKEKRERLFKESRPFIRPLEIYNGKGYSKDVGILWVGHQKTPYQWMGEVDQEQFANRLTEISLTEEMFVTEDENKNFKEGKGIVGVFSVINNGWKYEPHVQFMPWATKKNILRSCVGYFQYVRYSKQIGVCMAYALEGSVNLFDKCCEYGVLFKSGKIVNGDPRGDEYVYSISGRKKVKNVN